MASFTGCQSENESVVWPGLCECFSSLFVFAESVPSVVSCLLQVNNVEESRSVQDAPTLLVSEKGAGLLNASPNSVVSYPPAKVDSSYCNEDDYDTNEWVTLFSQERFGRFKCLLTLCQNHNRTELWASSSSVM